ncbi:MAG: hypothetical protein JW959_15110, partial [Pirellulales bacterium]|nr:hypothetical protein [Pirellulales bacterium]
MTDPRTTIPAIAKEPELLALIDHAVQEVPTTHDLFCGDARGMSDLEAESIHLVTVAESSKSVGCVLARTLFRGKTKLVRA